MKRSIYCVVAILSIFFLATEDAFARGGRGGGGGRSVAARPSPSRSPSMSRSPSVSRPAPRPSTPSRPATGAIQRPSTGAIQRPSTGAVQRPSTGAIQRPGTGAIQRPAAGQLPSGPRPSQGDLQQFLNLPAQRPAGPAVPSQRPAAGVRPAPGQLPATGVRPGAGQRPGGVQRPGGDRVNIGSGNRQININRTEINRQVNNRYQNIQNRPFTDSWRQRRPVNYPHLRHHAWHYRPGHWWRWATAATVTRWVVFGWARPYYYSYGSGGNVYYDNDTVYVNNEATCSSEEYYDQAATIASSVPEISDAQAEQVEWMSLGVFALTQEGVDTTNQLLQLAVSKEGIIAGTLFNETTGSERPVEGMVDQASQRAAWSFADGKNTDVVMETSIYSLTENEATALVHFGKDQTQTWVMVRLEDPEGQTPPS